MKFRFQKTHKMKRHRILIPIAAFLIMIFSGCSTDAQNSETEMAQTGESQVEIIQFHSEHRCMTCNKIETLTKQTLETYASIPFSLVNVDDEANEEKAESFEAFGTALFLYSPETGAKKELTEFAFMTAHDEEKFVEGLKKEIAQFTK